jgi:formate hydrogenlyase subunit 6/NADH:ubiquinone oxidoreductase subunit I
MCATDCPSQAIEMVVFDKKAKSIVFGLHVDRCTFCGQCTFSCKQGSLTLEHGNWELASLDRGNLMIHLGEAKDVQDVLAGITSRTPASPPGETPQRSNPPPEDGRGVLPASEAAGG